MGVRRCLGRRERDGFRTALLAQPVTVALVNRCAAA